MAILTSNYPTSLDTTSTLGEVTNRARTTLSVALASSGETQITLNDGSGFPNSGALTLDNEIIYYSSRATNVLTIESRAQQGTAAASHLVGALVYLRLTKGHWETARSAIIALQTKLGIGTSTPATTNHILGVNGSGQTIWGTPASFGITASGDVTKVGTPADNQVGVWTGSGTIEGTSGLTYDGSRLTSTGTTEQFRVAYDASNYFSTTVNTTGSVVFNAVGSGSRFTLSDGLTLPAGTATAGTSPLKLTTGTALTTPEDGAVEYHSSHVYFTIGSVRYQLDQQAGNISNTVYGAGWDGDTTNAPSKNAVFDRWQVVTKFYVLEDYADLAAALTAIGTSTDAELKVSSSVPIVADTVIPPNVYISFGDGGIFNVDVNITLTIHSLINPGNRKLYTGLGVMRVVRQPEVFVTWWTGKHPTANPQYVDLTAAMWSGIKTSGYGGSTVVFSEGRFRISVTLDMVDGMRIKGQASTPDPSFQVITDTNYFGTIIEVTANSVSGITVPGHLRNAVIEDICVYQYNRTSSVGIDIVADAAGMFNIQINRCSVYAGELGIRVKDSGAGYIVVGLKVDMCYFLGQSIACFKSESQNTGYTFNTTVFEPAKPLGSAVGTSVGVWLRFSGQSKFVNCTFNGHNFSQRAYTFTTTFATTTLTTGTHNITTNDVEPVTFSSTGTLPTGVVANQTYYFRAINSTQGNLFVHPRYIALGSPISLSGGSGTLTMRTTIPKGFSGTNSVPYAAFLVEYDMYGLSIDNCQEEGFQHGLVVRNTDDVTVRVIELRNNTFQSIMKLFSQAYIVSSGNTYINRPYKDVYGMAKPAHIYSYGDTIFYTSDMAETEHPVDDLATFVGNSTVVIEERKGRTTYNVYRKSGVTMLEGSVHMTGGGHIPVHEFVRDGDDDVVRPILRLGTKNSFERYATSYYDVSRSLTSGADAYRTGFLEIYSPNSPYNGLFVNGHFVTNGREVNTLQTALGTGNATINCATGSRFYGEPAGNVLYDFSNIVVGQRVSIRIVATTTSRTVTWGNGAYAFGNKTLQTGVVAGEWTVEFISIGPANMYQLSAKFSTDTGVSPQPKEFWNIATTSTLRVGQRVEANSGSQQVYTLPSVSVYGDEIEVDGTSTGGWRVSQLANQYIQYSEGTEVKVNKTTTGTGGYMTSADGCSYVKMRCTVANLGWKVISSHLGVNLE